MTGQHTTLAVTAARLNSNVSRLGDGMRSALSILALLSLAQASMAFDFMGVQSGQAESEAISILESQNLNVKKLRSGLYALTDKEAKGLGGWADFCEGRLAEIGMAQKYETFPDWLKSATVAFGNSKVDVSSVGFWKKEYQVTYLWEVGDERHSITTFSTHRQNPPPIVMVHWGYAKSCEEMSAANNSLKEDAEDGPARNPGSNRRAP